MKYITLDGGYGTNLCKYSDKIELLNIENQSAVYDLHKEYIKSGSKIILTNTFGVSQHENYNEIIKNGVKIAKRAVRNTKVKVAFNIGPDFLEKNRKFYEKIDKLDDIDYIFIETMTKFCEIKQAVKAFKSWDKPIFLLISPTRELKLYDKTTIYEVVKFAEENDVFAIGVNCGFGVDHVCECLELMKKHTKLPLVAKPNTGVGELDKQGATCGKHQEKMKKIIDLDVKYIGFCCGSTQEDIRILNSYKK